MEKPVKKYHTKPSYDFHEIMRFLEEKTGRDPRDWSGRFSCKSNPRPPYQDFWHYVIKNNEVNNGSHFFLIIDGRPETEPEWEFVNEIHAALRDLFPECNGEIYCYVDW